MKTQSTVRSFTSNNGEIVSSLFPQEFLDAIKVLSPHPIFKVPVRNGNMITSGEPKRCYWNSNLIAQTFGGEAIYGYIVEVVKEKYARNTIRLYGHGVWLNPEGKFVDVTPNNTDIYEYRFFLPIDEKLILNGVATEELRSIVWVGSDESIPLEFCCAVGSNKESLKAIQNLPSGDTDRPFISKNSNDEFEASSMFRRYKGKLVSVNAWDGVFVVNLMKMWWSDTGRFEYFVSDHKITAVIDYAHTPDALENVLKTIVDLRKGKEKIFTVFGCGGNRDKGKRSLMGEIASKFSDQIIITSDNPRNEDPESIIENIYSGIPIKHQEKVLTIKDRKEAISVACKMASSGDIILIAGKGHENYQIIGSETLQFDDMENAVEILKKLKK